MHDKVYLILGCDILHGRLFAIDASLTPSSKGVYMIYNYVVSY